MKAVGCPNLYEVRITNGVISPKWQDELAIASVALAKNVTRPRMAAP
jgi:hypothetical protein